MSHIHPPKVEVFDVRALTNTDPKGLVRAVDSYQVEPHALRLARPTPGHPRIAYLESWLVPALGVRVTWFEHHAPHPRDGEFYLDIVDIAVDGDVWRTRDLYLDVCVVPGRGLRVEDSDELLAAVAAGLLPAADAQRAMETTFDAVGGIAAHGYDVDAWLAAHGVPVTWSRPHVEPVDVAPDRVRSSRAR